LKVTPAALLTPNPIVLSNAATNPPNLIDPFFAAALGLAGLLSEWLQL